MLNVDGEKMSKSLGNFRTIRDVLQDAPAEALRLLLLGTHYRSVLNFTHAGLLEARRTLDRFYRAIQGSGAGTAGPVPDEFLGVLCQDLNTPGAIALLHRMADAALAGQQQAEQWFRAGADADAVERAIAERLAARQARDFARADAIRARLVEDGIVLEDGPAGTTWRRA